MHGRFERGKELEVFGLFAFQVLVLAVLGLEFERLVLVDLALDDLAAGQAAVLEGLDVVEGEGLGAGRGDQLVVGVGLFDVVQGDLDRVDGRGGRVDLVRVAVRVVDEEVALEAAVLAEGDCPVCGDLDWLEYAARELEEDIVAESDEASPRRRRRGGRSGSRGGTRFKRGGHDGAFPLL